MKKRKPCISEHNGHKCWGALNHEFKHWAVVDIGDGPIKIYWSD